MWDRAITEDEVKELSNCNLPTQSPKGNVISWDRLNRWENHNVTIEQVENVCNDEITPSFIIFNQRMNFDEITLSCHTLGGTHPHEFTAENELRYNPNILRLVEEQFIAAKSPCISTAGETNRVKFWLGFKFEGSIYFFILI